MYEELIKSLRTDHDKYFARDMEAADAIEELQKACEEAYSKGLLEGGIAQRAEDEKWLPHWISVTERLPDNIDEEVLVCTEDYGKSDLGFATVAIYDGSGWLECWQRKTYLAAVTNWMPLPEPPKEKPE